MLPTFRCLTPKPQIHLDDAINTILTGMGVVLETKVVGSQVKGGNGVQVRIHILSFFIVFSLLVFTNILSVLDSWRQAARANKPILVNREAGFWWQHR